MIITVIGGRDRHPSLAEIERVVAELRPGCVLRHPTASAPGKIGTERLVGRYVKARGLAEVEPWPTRAAAMAGDLIRPPADLLLALDGGESTRSTIRAARKRGVPVIEIEPVAEPRIWNRHHGAPPGPSVYIGGNERDPSAASPLANPFLSWRNTQPVGRILDAYRSWLAAKLRGEWCNAGTFTPADPAVVAALDEITADHFMICSCWPNPCHGEVVVRAWRWWSTGGREKAAAALAVV